MTFAVVCDLDGVIWLWPDLLPGAAEAVARLREAGLRVAFLTNNASQKASTYCQRLNDFGIPAVAEDMMTSAQAAATLLAGSLPSGARVLACADEGVVDALTEAGLTAVEEAPCEAVVVGYHRHFDYERLARAATAIRGGARFVATNVDATLPTPEGLLPGNGSLVAAVATASGQRPVVAGKPEPPTVALVRGRVGLRGVMVGDRPSTDGALAAALGWPFALVASEATGTDEPVETAFSAPSLAELVGPIIAAFGERQP